MHYSFISKNNEKICILIAFLMCICTHGKRIHAESMSGATYTLNGSVNVIASEGQGGTYTLNPSGDAVLIETATGGAYTLYPTPYGSQAPTVTVNTPGLSEVISAIVSGSGSDTFIINQSSSTVSNPHNPNLPANPNTRSNNNGTIVNVHNNGGINGGQGVYQGQTDPGYVPPKGHGGYGYPAQNGEGFGKKTSTSSRIFSKETVRANRTLLWIILIGLLIIALRLWNTYRKSL